LIDHDIAFLFACVLQIDLELVVDDLAPKDLSQWSSMNHLNLITAFEEAYDIEFEPEEVAPSYENFEAFQKKVLEKREM
jgi:acyl carrier protein